MKKLVISGLMLTSSLLASDVLAVVNGESITKSEINNLLKAKNLSYSKLPPKYRIQILNNMVDNTLLMQQVKNSKVGETKEYREGVANFKKQWALRIFLQQKLKSFKVTNTEIVNFYNKYKDLIFKQPAAVKLRYLVVKDKKQAYNLIRALKHTKKSKLSSEFTRLVKKYSIGAAKQKGGELGWIAENKLIPSFRKAIASVKPGSFTTTPVKTKLGWSIAYIEDKKPEQYVPLKKVKNVIIREVKLQKLKDYITQLKEKAKIKYK